MSNVEQHVTEPVLARVSAVGSREEGQGLVEYALIIALVAVFLTGALTLLQGGISGTFSTIVGSL
jgi:pilus assembly protein Flp/PilA